MDDNIHIRLLLPTIATVFLFILTNLPQSHSQEEDTKYTNCSKPYNCGGVSNIFYPFWGQNRPQYCGGGGQLDFELECQNDNTTNLNGSPNFQVLHIDTTAYTIRMKQRVDDVCSPTFNNDIYFDLDPTLFAYYGAVYNITIFYNCSSSSSDFYREYDFACRNGNGTYRVGDEDDVLNELRELQYCERHIQVPIQVPLEPYGNRFDALKRALDAEFEVNYTIPHALECKVCLDSKGACGVNLTTQQFTCYCRDGSDAIDCYGRGTLNLTRKIIIGVCSAVFGALVVFSAFYFYRRRKKNSYAKSYVQSQSFSSDPSLKDPEKGSQYFGVHLFAYSELEEATNHFDSSRELGEGGFGTVYFGKLRDGRGVAVKRLYENNCRRVEQFMNEVQILTGLVHPNLVSLYGCTSRHSRELLLVYEYIPNGTVADHLHGEQAKPGTLSWHTRMDIAVETASALNYLHVSGIIHRDVKTNNILLDNHFRVKVADFGLSRLFPNDLSHVSTAPQGTPGYVDPEYHECYQLTNKSDVYSFGVVLIELISSLPAVDITRHRHEINLSNMAINKIHSQALHELVDPTLGFESDYKIRKMINAVAELAFQCLQSSKDVRPSMEEVFNTLKDIQSDGKYKSQPEVMDISSSTENVVLLKDDPPPPSPDSNAVSKSTTPNASG